MNESRIQKSIKNTLIALGEQGINTIMSFLCRTVFIYTLGKTYLGISGLFSDILALLSLAELGVGTAILYSMYKPIAMRDYRRVAAILNLYRKVYHTIGILITIIGISLTPFLGYLISDLPDIPELSTIYLMYLISTSTSYFFVYKKSVIIAEQRNYVSSIVYICTSTVQNILQIVFLLSTYNFIIYLLIQILFGLANNIVISIYVNYRYPYLKQYRNEQLDAESKEVIYGNVKAMFVSKLSSTIVTSTDNLLISKFVSTVELGLYSNYTLFTNILRTVYSKIFDALTGSIGNLVALESGEIVYKTFKKIWFVNFWIVSFSCAALYALVDDFIELWIGDTYLIEKEVVFLVCLNLYMRFIRNTFITFTDTYGMFKQLRFKCLAEAFINLNVSLVFVSPMKLGICGVLLGTFFSNIVTNFWFEPYLLYTTKFHVSMKKYFLTFLVYLGLTFISGGCSYWICEKCIFIEGWGGFLIKVIIICVFINLLYTAVFWGTDEFKYLKKSIKGKFRNNR